MKTSPSNLNDLIDIFQKTLEDKTFSRSEKKAVTRVLAQDYSLDKTQRDLLRDRIFQMARDALRTETEVLDWLETANKLLLNRQDSAVFFSPGEACRQAVIDQLKQATTSVDICVFTISDNRISNVIEDCHRKGVPIRLITDDEKMNDTGSDIAHLIKTGIEVKIDDSRFHMHHKFAIFDRERVLTGSYNWTRSAADYNQENILLTDDQRVVAGYRQEFEKLWDQFDTHGL